MKEALYTFYLAVNWTNVQYNDTLVEVSGYRWSWVKNGQTMKCYIAKTHDGKIWCAQEFQLREVTK